MPTITTVYTGEMAFTAEAGGHRLTIDVPAGMGGRDRGPTPPELFVVSLGSCIAAYVATYCEQHGVDTTGLAAIRRVAQHCPVHETIATLSGIHINVLDRTTLAAT